MNLEEARKHIGKEVVLDESTKPYRLIIGNELHEKAESTIKEGHRTIISAAYEAGDVKIVIFDSQGNKVDYWYINPIHLKLKQPNYKIRVTEETSAEVQELFFQLGGSWSIGKRIYTRYKFSTLYLTNGNLIGGWEDNIFLKSANQEITLPELRKLVLDSKNEYGFETEIERHEVEEMTWQDAYIAMANGQQVQVWVADGDRWETINHHDNWSIAELAQERIRLEPPSINLEARAYTKEELLKIVEGME